MTIRNFHFNILLGLNSFIVFLLLFDGRIELPAFLQVFGRLHPLLLHFPIVLMFLSWLLIFFRKRLAEAFPVLKPIIDGLIFISAVLAAITVIMGLFLANEGGYEGSSFQWHKWTGVALSLLTYLLFYFSTHQKQDQYHPFFMAGVNLSLILLLFVGHFGATLTHGDNFVLEPLFKDESKGLDMESAVVFKDAVYPILEAKCMSCHNSDKAKGELILTDTLSLLAGGKNGKLLVAGSPLQSLLIERLLLDIDHKHRMPPKGKPQLSDVEVALLQAWVSNGAKFNTPLSALGEKDTLFQAVQLVYGIEDEEHYDFSEADASLVEKLNTPYRVIQPLANGSPALAVSFYGQDFYNSESLAKLSSIANQVVSINLSGMPVKPADIQLLTKFKNLRELNLNYTSLKDEDLSPITGLSNLKSLNLTGTKLSVDGAKELLSNEALKKLFVWNTLIKDDELKSLNKQFSSKYISGGG